MPLVRGNQGFLSATSANLLEVALSCRKDGWLKYKENEHLSTWPTCKEAFQPKGRLVLTLNTQEEQNLAQVEKGYGFSQQLILQISNITQTF